MTDMCAIINITPDSFSGDGTLHHHTLFIDSINKAVASGAKMIDVGAQSTRPGASIIYVEEEIKRLSMILPTAKDICEKNDILLSVDTCTVEGADYAIQSGAHIINDVRAAILPNGANNDKMISLLRSHEAVHYIFMHHLTIPADKNVILPDSSTIIEDVLMWRDKRISYFTDNGICKERLVFDPGLGFGKSHVQSFQLLRSIDRLNDGAVPLMMGHSRKSFLGHISGNDHAAGRDIETVIASCYAVSKKTNWLRVHNIEAHMHALKLHDALYETHG